MSTNATLLAAIENETPTDQTNADLALSHAGGQEGNLPDFLKAEGENKTPEPGTPKGKTPAKVTIGDQQYTAEEAEKLISMGKDSTKKWMEASQAKADAQQLLAANNAALDLWNVFTALPDALQTELTQRVEAWQRGGGGQSGFAPQDGLPAIPGGKLPTLEWDELSEEGKLTYGLVIQTQNAVRELAKTLNEFRPLLTEMHQNQQDQRFTQALEAKGVKLTPEKVREMRAAGITDPVKAIEFFGPMLKGAFNAGAVAEGNNPKAPPEGPGGSQDNVYDDSDPNLTADQEMVLLGKGMIPKSKAQIGV